MRSFTLTLEEEKLANKWIKEHVCTAPPATIGGRISFIFIPTGLGIISEVKCICGKTLVLEELENA